MSLSESYWENYLDKLKNTITDVINNNLIDHELQDELLELYKTLDDKNISLDERKQKAKLVDHYLEMCNDIVNDDYRKRL